MSTLRSTLRAWQIVAFGIGLGFFGILSQTILMREALSLSSGNELVLGLSLAAWLLGVALGSAVFGRIPAKPNALVPLSVASVVMVTAAALLLRLHRSVFGLASGDELALGPLMTTLIIALGIGGLTTGALFIATSRLLKTDVSKRPVSALYIAEALGTLVGGLFFSLIAANHWNHLVTLGLGGGALLAGTAFLVTKPAQRWAALALAAAWVGVSCSPVGRALDSDLTQTAFASHRTGARLAAAAQSAYGQLWLAEHQGQYELYSDGRFVRAFPDPWNREPPVHLALTQHPAPRRVLIVGDGPTDRIGAALGHGAAEVVLTYLDDRSYQLTKPHFDEGTSRLMADPRVRRIPEDGRRFISRQRGRFDVILICARPPLTAAANRYYTREFFAEVKTALSPTGVMTLVTEGSANIMSREATISAATVVATARTVFRELVLVPGTPLTIHATDRPGIISQNPELLAQRYRERSVSSTSFSARRFDTLLEPLRLENFQQSLQGVDATVNSDLEPTVFLRSLARWERSIARERETAARPLVTRLEILAWAAPGLIVVVWCAAMLLLFVNRTQAVAKRLAGLFAVSTTGAAGMIAQVAIFFAYQIYAGMLYKMIALITALFMMGLTLGALAARTLVGRTRFASPILADAMVLLFLAAATLVMPATYRTPEITIFLAVLAGAVTGYSFPVFLQDLIRPRGGDEKSAAASMQTADHLGAALGAITGGVVLLPLLGVGKTLLLIAGIKLLSMILLITRARAAGTG